MKARFRVTCRAKDGERLFIRSLKSSTAGHAIKDAKDYARKKGIDPKGCKFELVE